MHAWSQHDPENQFDTLVQSWAQVAHGSAPLILAPLPQPVRQIVICGVGGSAISADILRNALQDELDIPLHTLRSYHLPHWVGSDTLVIASSYSGNTEETLSAVQQALERECPIVCLTTGGMLQALAREHDLREVALQTGLQPRYALYTSLFTLVRTLHALELIPAQTAAIAACEQRLRDRAEALSQPVNAALNLAESLVGTLPVVYSAVGLNEGAGVRLKSQFNENSKMQAFHHSFPEMNHNEIVGWESAHELGIRWSVLLLDDPAMPVEISRRYGICADLLAEQDVPVYTLQGQGLTPLERLVDLAYFGDWLTYYLAVLRGKDPSEIDFIHHLKRALTAV